MDAMQADELANLVAKLWPPNKELSRGEFSTERRQFFARKLLRYKYEDAHEILEEHFGRVQFFEIPPFLDDLRRKSSVDQPQRPRSTILNTIIYPAGYAHLSPSDAIEQYYSDIRKQAEKTGTQQRARTFEYMHNQAAQAYREIGYSADAAEEAAERLLSIGNLSVNQSM